MDSHTEDTSAILGAFIVGSTVTANVTTDFKFLEGLVAAYIFEKEGSSQTIGFFGNDFGTWTRALLPPKTVVFTDFNEWIDTGRALVGNILSLVVLDEDTKTYSDHSTGNKYIYSGEWPEFLEGKDVKYLVEAMMYNDSITEASKVIDSRDAYNAIQTKVEDAWVEGHDILDEVAPAYSPDAAHYDRHRRTTAKAPPYELPPNMWVEKVETVYMITVRDTAYETLNAELEAFGRTVDPNALPE